MKKNKVLLITNVMRSFVQEDINLLNRDYEVKVYNFDVLKYKSKIGRLILMFKHLIAQSIWLLYHLPNTKFIYGWFVDYHLLIPVLFKKLFNKKLIIALGGFECIHIPSLKYGIYESSWRKKIITYIIPKSDMLLPVTERLISSDPTSINWPDAYPNGLKHHISNFNTPYKVLYTAYNDKFWSFLKDKRKKVICTIAIIPNEITFLRKGGDLFIETARNMPNYTFNLIGLEEKQVQFYKKKYNAPDNVIFLPKQAREKLRDFYREASIYLQLSRAEGLPNVLCEAMLCGCIPIGSAVFGIPEAIQDTGFIVKRPNISDIKKAIINVEEKIEKDENKMREMARKRIQKDFLLEGRYKKLQEIINL